MRASFLLMKRRVRIEYDCPSCSARAIHMETIETDETEEALLGRVVEDVRCMNQECLMYSLAHGNMRACRIVPARA